MNNLIEGIFTLIQKDTENPIKQSERLAGFYEICTDVQKKAIDNAMICICGYSLNTIINSPEEIQV